MFYGHWFLNYHVVKSLPPINGTFGSMQLSHVVANWGSMSYYGTSMAMDKKFWPSHKVCDYSSNFMVMSCLLHLTIL
jgi:hypothetical protein